MSCTVTFTNNTAEFLLLLKIVACTESHSEGYTIYYASKKVGKGGNYSDNQLKYCLIDEGALIIRQTRGLLAYFEYYLPGYG